MPAEEGLRADEQNGTRLGKAELWLKAVSTRGVRALPARAADLAFEDPELVTEGKHLSPEPSSRQRTREYKRAKDMTEEHGTRSASCNRTRLRADCLWVTGHVPSGIDRPQARPGRAWASDLRSSETA